MKKKILLIDDDRVFLKYFTRQLEDAGHEVQTVEDGVSALEMLTDFTPDVIFLDLILPKIDGDKLCRIIRSMKHLSDCYLVVISAVVAEIENSYEEIGADAYIAKGPFATVTRHALSAVEVSSKPRSKSRPGPIMGLDTVSPRQLTRELLSRNRHLQTILESMSEGILEVIEGKIVYANSAAVSMFQLPLEKILTAYPPNLFDESVRIRLDDLMKSAGRGTSEIGEKNPVDLRGRQVTIKYLPVNREASISIVLITDVTERKRLEMQLQHAQKMEAIGTIASGVAHNFRNTLTGILVNSQVIQENYPDESELLEVVNRIDSSVKRGARLVDRLMQFSRKETTKEFKRIDLVAVIAETYQIVKKSFDQKIDIRLNLYHSLPIMGDHLGLSQVFMNLFTNARDAMPEGGILEIDARQEGTLAVVSVTDSGEGMDLDTRKKCFDPFFTTKEVGKGTGLGLSTTYGIVKSHKGEIQVASTPGKGTKFIVRFQLIEDGDIAETVCPTKIVRGKGEPILVVDDEREIQTAMRDLLECLGYTPVMAGMGVDALDSYKTARPMAVLMDVNMPKENGITCADRILEFDPGAKIVILSGYDRNGPELSDKHLNDAIKGYLTKPVDIAELSNLLARLVG